MRDVPVSAVTDAVARLFMEANYRLPPDVEAAVRAAAESEPWQPARSALETICRNIDVAGEGRFPLCQDTGMVTVWLSVGQEAHFTGGSLCDAVNEGVRRGCRDGYLRASVVGDPLRRKNTGDGAPAVIHCDIVPGDGVKIELMPKGFGSENMSRTAMLKPADGVEGVRAFVLRAVAEAGPNPCPPVALGIGIGGGLDKAAEMAKHALLRPFGEHNPDAYYAALEHELLESVNALGIGPQGFGGRTTALSVAIETYPTHIAGLPVAVNICCHVCRRGCAEV